MLCGDFFFILLATFSSFTGICVYLMCILEHYIMLYNMTHTFYQNF